MEIRQQNNPVRGPYRLYDANRLTDAYNAVQEGTMTIRRACKVFAVPKSTLCDRLHGKIDIDVVQSGTPPLFSQEQEAFLANHVKVMADVGYGYSRQETINLASDYAIHLGLRDKDHPLTDKWFYKFLQRWPDLKVVKPRSLDVARAKSATRLAVDNYFRELENILVKYGLKDKPHLVYNVDEKGLSTEHKPPKIVSGNHHKTQAVTSGKSNTVTLIGGVNAIGHQVPPFLCFQVQGCWILY
ncbi:uncharacterized protein LOC123560449 isoform X3 [Mercenaria mercenaria]|uniref:uncharacterized protein LOC123560449 isoform X3 n=1 Tax=Mercenaria mercenaria TaxID=6596 RepID=UPI00234EAF22|nr:uncharacterized protein LOC123560449 isoform X3 [Mercenaria mercenaria]XP_053399614.1 uncharacterized protein LOC123560449 isoform X3 [Mercenaria mercenaria]